LHALFARPNRAFEQRAWPAFRDGGTMGASNGWRPVVVNPLGIVAGRALGGSPAVDRLGWPAGTLGLTGLIDGISRRSATRWSVRNTQHYRGVGFTGAEIPQDPKGHRSISFPLALACGWLRNQKRRFRHLGSADVAGHLALIDNLVATARFAIRYARTLFASGQWPARIGEASGRLRVPSFRK